LPLTVNKVAPGPVIVRLVLTTISPEVSVMVVSLRDGSKTMVSPLAASNTACRSDPVPLSLVIETVHVAASTREALARKAQAGRTEQKNNLQTRLQIGAMGASIDRVVFVSWRQEGGFIFFILCFT
jgi:hypothetical protein